MRTFLSGLVTILALALTSGVLTAGTAQAATGTVQTIGTAQAATGTQTLRPAQVTSFTWVDGNEMWKQQNLARLMRSTFTVSPDGRFVMSQPDGYPTLVGTLSGDGTVKADSSSSTSVGNTHAEVLGTWTWTAGP